MSAFLVDNAHIDVLIDCAKQYAISDRYESWFSWGSGSQDAIHEANMMQPGNETEVGRMLLAENARSVGYRYREAQDPAALLYTYKPTGRTFSPGEIIKAVGCFGYQSCETPGWEKSKAFAFCQELKERVLRSLAPMPDSAPWGYTEETLGRKPAAVRVI